MNLFNLVETPISDDLYLTARFCAVSMIILASPHSCMIWYSTCKNFGLYAISINGHLWKLIVNTNKLLWLRLIINMVSKRTCFYGLQICNHVDHLYFFFSHFNLLYSMIYPNHLNSVSYFSTRPFDDRKSKTWFY